MVLFFFFHGSKLYKTNILCNDKRLIFDAFNFMSVCVRVCVCVCVRARERVSVLGLQFSETSVTLASLLHFTNGADVVGIPAFLTIYLL